MIVRNDQPAGNKPAGADAHRPPHDPRIVAFVAFIRAVDGRDSLATRDASRELRHLGISICLTAPAQPGGGAA